MTDKSDVCKIWTRFESKKADGSIIKLRIQGRAMEVDGDVFEFLMKYFVEEEAVHKAAGVSKNPEALQELRELMSVFFNIVPMHATVCCVDNDSNSVGEILGLSIVQLMKCTDKLEDIIKDMEFNTAEVKQLLYAAKILDTYSEDKSKYEIFYYGRGIIVHPDYRKLGIANKLVEVRTLICADNNIPVTFAWMSSMGTQKAAENNNWKTLAEVPLEELEEKTGLTFANRIPSFKFMYATID